MRHKAGDFGHATEPNLTPLLDLVLQILMFFMVTFNVSAQRNSGDIALPRSETGTVGMISGKDSIHVNAIPVEALLKMEEQGRPSASYPLRKEGDFIYVADVQFYKNESVIKVVGVGIKNEKDFESWINRKYANEAQTGEVKHQVILRAHRDMNYRQVYRVLQMCTLAGFKDLKVRTMIKQGT